MSEDLAPAPWACRQFNSGELDWLIEDASGSIVLIGKLPEPLARKICEWRNAEEIQQRRGWWAEHADPDGGRWAVQVNGSWSGAAPQPTHSAALISADEWMKERGE